MKQHLQSFSHGINQDLSTNKYSDKNIYWAQNFRFISKDGLATGALTNVKGTSAKLSLGNGEEVIVGYCLIRDTLITFVSSPEGGKIYMWEYNDTDFEESPTLIYTDPNLNFSTDYPVRAVGRYETSNIQKIYFTDGNSFFKFLNIIPQTGESYPLNLHRPVDSLDLVPDVAFSDINLELVSGGNLKAGKIQYAYQLYSKRGSESVFSPASKLIHLTDSDNNTNSSRYKGSEVGTSVNKSVIVSINDVDPDDDELYTRLRLVALEYTVLDQIPSVRIVGEYNIENLESLTVTDTGLSKGELTLEEFRFIQNDFYPKTIDIKNDILFAANIKNNYFDVADFDSRAFRFNSGGVCTVYDGENAVVVSSDWSNLPSETSESFNKFNDWTNDYTGETGAVTTYHYKYQSDGATLGGEGPNISYTFTTDRVLLDESAITYFTRNNHNLPKNNLGVNSPYENYADYDTKVGYKRDEVYRFGIVFFDKKGRQSFVKWIGDIRFPDNKEMPFIHYDPAESNKIYADILGIEFTVDISSITEDILGYQIVRAERKAADRTILGQGLIGSMVDGGNQTTDTDHMYSLATTPYISDCLNAEVKTQRWAIRADNSRSEPITRIGTTLTNEYMEFVSPEIAFNKPNYTTSDAYLEVEGYLNTTQSTSLLAPNSGTYLLPIISDKYKKFTGYPDFKYRKSVDYYKTFTAKSISNTTGDSGLNATLSVLEDGVIFDNQTNTVTTDDTRWGMRGTFGLCKTNTGFPIATASIPWTGYNAGEYDHRVFLGNYRIDKGRSLYGGSSYEARTSTTYYPVSTLQTSGATFEVFGGDTFINYFFYMRSMWDNSRATTVDDKEYSSDDIIEVVSMFPVESSINIDLRLDNINQYMNWAAIRGGDWSPNYKIVEDVSVGASFFGLDYPVELGSLYRYNSVYSAIDKSKEFYSEPFDFDYTLINDTRITASEKKINGEYIDSWTKFKFANILDVDSKHNAITKILTFKNNLFFFQPTAVGIASVNDRSLIQDNQPGQLTLGTGGVLPRYDYVTDKSGSEYYEGILASDDFLFYADGRRKRINKLVPGKEVAISVVKGIDSTLDKLAWETVVGGFDRGYNEVLFSIDGTTMAFSEMADAFMSSYTFSPGLMFSINKDFFSTGPGTDEDISPWLYADPQVERVGYSGDTDVDEDWDFILIGPGSDGSSGTLYKHNVGDPGVFHNSSGAEDSYLTLILNPEGNNVCYFDNLDLRTESTTSGVDDPDDIFYRLEASNNYQEITRELAFSMNQSSGHTGTVKRIGRVWRTPIMATPPSGNSYSRMMDTYLKVTLRYSNVGNTFRLHDVKLLYRPTNH